jgi:crotonobetainyl-CoA:carnitine CoA-transferase CaiB-like acyl-CoA transferase
LNRPEPPLEGTLVLSVGHTLPGLYDLGAEVVRGEHFAPRGEAGSYAAISERFPTRSFSVGTSWVALDRKQGGGIEALERAGAAMGGEG